MRVTQSTMTANSPSGSDVKPVIPQAYSDVTSDRRSLWVDTEAVMGYARWVNEALRYNTPKPIVNNDCHLCSTTCEDQRHLRQHPRNKHPEKCTDLGAIP